MGQAHPRTPEQRAQWGARMLAHQGDYGMVTTLSREAQVSRPTRYVWRDHAQAALLAAFSPPATTEGSSSSSAMTPRQVLTLWISHASVRGIQYALAEVRPRGVSRETITTILAEADQRARTWMQTHVRDRTRALAFDEIYANDRRGAYLNVVDVHSGAVWASEGPLAVDTEIWILVRWELQARGLRWERVVLDGGAPMLAACRSVTPHIVVQGDIAILHRLLRGVKALAGLIRLKPRLHATTPRGLLYHSIMRPHLAVHRTLSTGMLALLAVWHKHRVFTRGIHTGKTPLHLSGMTDAPTDWLTALGYYYSCSLPGGEAKKRKGFFSGACGPQTPARNGDVGNYNCSTTHRAVSPRQSDLAMLEVELALAA